MSDLRRTVEFQAALEAALLREPANALLHHRLGALHFRRGDLAAAASSFREALRCRPAYAAAQTGLGAALRQLGDVEGALAAYRVAIALDPAEPMARYNLANLLQALDDPAAGEAYGQAIALRPDWASAHYNHGVWLLKQGRYDPGWAEYEWRWRTARFQAVARQFEVPQWTGQPVAGATVLVHVEQGLGDLIQCARYIPLMVERGARVVLETPASLRTLFSSLGDDALMIEPGGPTPRCDYHCPYLSLPYGFGTRLDSVPARIPYLRTDTQQAAAWAARLPQGFRIGVVWQGNPEAQVERGRSFRLAELAPIAGVAGVRLISLQKAHGLDQLDGPGPGFEIATLGGTYDRGDFAETAAVVANLDLVIACDTSVVHLTGALGRAVWVGLKPDADWRWLRGRADSPWYPTARLYRQEREGDWGGVFAQMAADLAAQIGAGSGGR